MASLELPKGADKARRRTLCSLSAPAFISWTRPPKFGLSSSAIMRSSSASSRRRVTLFLLLALTARAVGSFQPTGFKLKRANPRSRRGSDAPQQSASAVEASSPERPPRERKGAVQEPQQKKVPAAATAKPNDAKKPPAAADTQAEKVSSSAAASHEPLDLPWNDSQKWALRDKVSRFTVQVPAPATEQAANNNNNKQTMKCYVLWRNLAQDTPELLGYPLPFLAERLRDLREEEGAALPAHHRADHSRIILPCLDDFRFEPDGGISGRVSGAPGVADGTRLHTTPVGDVGVTLPRGFARTADGSATYELGRPAPEEQPRRASLDGGNNRHVKDWQRDGRELAASMVASKRDLMSANDSGEWDPELIQLAGLTGLMVAGAAAVEALSHHLTVNVFWV